MRYDYKCQNCGAEMDDDSFRPIGSPHPSRKCPLCGGVFLRAICRVSIQRGMDWGGSFQPHFNQTVGEPVTSLRDFHEKLAAKARANTEATGIEHVYTTTDPRDRAAFGITDEAVELNEAVDRGEQVDGDGQFRQTPSRAVPPVETGDFPDLIGEKD